MTDYNKYSITSVVKDFDEEEMEGRQVRFSLNTLDDVFFLIDDDTEIREDNQTLTKYATTDTDGEAGVYVYIESSVESATVNASIDGINEQIIIFNTGIRVSSVAIQTDKNTIYNGNKNENATLTATVTASETYTGVVAFYDGNTLLGTVSAVNNVATFTLESTNHSMVTPTVTRNIRAVAGGVNSNVLEITDYYTYPEFIRIRPYYKGNVVAQVPENETWTLQIGLRDNRHAAVPNATGTVRIDGVEHEITLGNDGFWNYNITNGSGTGSVSVAVSFGNLTDSLNVGIVLHDCTDIMFNQASYTADSDGNVTLEVALINDDVAVPNATVSLSDGVSIYTGITNSNGVATFNLTGLSSSATWTCSYNNVTDTCTIRVGSYLFYDACDTDNTNLYDTTTNYSNSTFTFDSNNSCYTMQRTSGTGMASLWIKDLTVTDKVKITVDMKLATTSTVIMQGGPIIMNSTKNKGFLTMIEGYSGGDGEYSLGTTNSPNSHGTKIIVDKTLGLDARDYWLTYELIIDGSSVELNIYNGSTLIKTGTITSSQLDSTGNIVGLLMSYGSGAKISVKNIKVEPI